MRGRRLVLALSLACGAAALAGCGVARTVDPVAAAATKTANAGGVKVAMTLGVVGPGGQTFNVAANGAFDQDAADVTVDASSLLAAGNLPSTDGSIEVRYLEENGDAVLYINAPFLSSMLPIGGGKSWFRLDLQQVGKGAGLDFNQLLGQANQNPAQVLDLLRASGSVEKVGTETVNGESTTHYKATIDLATAAGKLGPDAQAKVQGLIDQGAPSSIPVDVWIGDDGLVRKLTLDETVTHDGQAGGVHLTLNFSDYGTAVNVAAPPSGDTLDLTALATQFAQSAQSGSGSATLTPSSTS
jgi:hypothetical protein